MKDNETKPLTQEQAEQKVLEMAAKTFGLDLECLSIIPDPAGWVVKDRCTGEKYVVPAKLQKDLGFPADNSGIVPTDDKGQTIQ